MVEYVMAQLRDVSWRCLENNASINDAVLAEGRRCAPCTGIVEVHRT